MTKIINGQLNKKLNTGTSVSTKFIVNESYKGVKSLSAIFKDIILSEMNKKIVG